MASLRALLDQQRATKDELERKRGEVLAHVAEVFDASRAALDARQAELTAEVPPA